jgi:hypothetical protein
VRCELDIYVLFTRDSVFKRSQVPSIDNVTLTFLLLRNTEQSLQFVLKTNI